MRVQLRYPGYDGATNTCDAILENLCTGRVAGRNRFRRDPAEHSDSEALMLDSSLLATAIAFAISDAMKVLKAEFRRSGPPNSSEWPPLAPGNRTEDVIRF